MALSDGKFKEESNNYTRMKIRIKSKKTFMWNQ